MKRTFMCPTCKQVVRDTYTETLEARVDFLEARQAEIEAIAEAELPHNLRSSWGAADGR
jgi:hypothetical protein